MRSRTDLFDYQRQAAERMARAKRIACFLEPGYGKTATTLTALHDLGRPRTLVLAPARVADTVWHAEALEWEHLHDLKITRATGDRDQRQAAMLSDADVVTLSYENLPWLLSTFKVEKLFDAVVFDELSRMKATDSVRFRRFRRVVPHIPIRIGLTGTPVGNHLLDLWGEMYMIGGEAVLGATKGEYIARYFDPAATLNGRVISWKPKSFAQKEIEQRIWPFAFTLRPQNAPPMPEARVNTIAAPVPEEVEKMAKEYVRDLTLKLNNGVDLYAFSSTTASMQVRQMVGGAVYVKPPTVLGEPAGERTVEHIHGGKLQALEELVGELQGQPVLVFYWFRHERDRILKHFPKARELAGPADIEAWNAGKVEVLLAHPASAGHGLNLQHGGHHVCWFTLPYSLEMWKQANGRLVRQGQKSPWVQIHVLMGGASDEKVLALLGRKDTVERQLLEAMLR